MIMIDKNSKRVSTTRSVLINYSKFYAMRFGILLRPSLKSIFLIRKFPLAVQEYPVRRYESFESGLA